MAFGGLPSALRPIGAVVLALPGIARTSHLSGVTNYRRHSMSAVMIERDPRAMNRMDPETKIVHARLERWGKWAKENYNAWPAVTLLGRIVEQGPGASQQGRPPVSMSEEDAQTDAAVAKLGEIDRKVIIEYYTKWRDIETAARNCRMRVRQFHSVLRRARWRIEGRLSK